MIGQLVKDLLQAVVVVPLVVWGIVVIIPSGHHRNPDWSKQLCCIFGTNQFIESYWPDWIFLLNITCALPRQAHQRHSGTHHEPHCTFTHSDSLQSHLSSKIWKWKPTCSFCDPCWCRHCRHCHQATTRDLGSLSSPPWQNILQFQGVFRLHLHFRFRRSTNQPKDYFDEDMLLKIVNENKFLGLTCCQKLLSSGT